MKKILMIIVPFILLLSCRKEDAMNPEGPDLNNLYGDFSIVKDLTINNEEVDFSAGETLIFDAELSKQTNWVIEINGESSGAVRKIEGSNRIISAENATWDGGADRFPGFGQEKAFISVTFPNESNAPTLTDSVILKGLKQDKGTLITSFEEGLGDSWERFSQSTVNGNIFCDDLAAKGDCYYGWNGTVGWDWAIGSVTINPESGTFNLQSSASNLFFNIAFKAMENFGPDNSFLLFWFDEDDNEDGVFDPNTEDRYTYEYWSKNSEWDLISLRYSDLQFDAEGNSQEVNGNGLPEPGKLISINVFFLANPDNGNARALVDHLIFTTNEPYKP